MTTKEETTMEEEVKDPQAVLTALRAAQEDIKNLRAELASANKEKDSLKEAAEQDAWRARAINAETKAALTAQGIKDVDKVLKYVKTDGLDFDDKGNLTGLDDKLKEWKADLPAVFDAKTRAGGKADIFANDVAEETPDPLREQVRFALTGGN